MLGIDMSENMRKKRKIRQRIGKTEIRTKGKKLVNQTRSSRISQKNSRTDQRKSKDNGRIIMESQHTKIFLGF